MLLRIHMGTVGQQHVEALARPSHGKDRGVVPQRAVLEGPPGCGGEQPSVRPAKAEQHLRALLPERPGALVEPLHVKFVPVAVVQPGRGLEEIEMLDVVDRGRR